MALFVAYYDIIFKPMILESRYYGRAKAIAQFYTVRMSLRIKDLRKSKGLTQEQLANMARMSRSQLAEIETEKRPANTLRLNAIAAALDVKVEDLFSSTEGAHRIVGVFKSLSAEDQDAILRMAEALAARDK
jgi:transcriptional regulator with XRE-family HTH domain